MKQRMVKLVGKYLFLCLFLGLLVAILMAAQGLRS